jgi:hypothetical protein
MAVEHNVNPSINPNRSGDDGRGAPQSISGGGGRIGGGGRVGGVGGVGGVSAEESALQAALIASMTSAGGGAGDGGDAAMAAAIAASLAESGGGGSAAASSSSLSSSSSSSSAMSTDTAAASASASSLSVNGENIELICARALAFYDSKGMPADELNNAIMRKVSAISFSSLNHYLHLLPNTHVIMRKVGSILFVRFCQSLLACAPNTHDKHSHFIPFFIALHLKRIGPWRGASSARVRRRRCDV